METNGRGTVELSAEAVQGIVTEDVVDIAVTRSMVVNMGHLAAMAFMPRMVRLVGVGPNREVVVIRLEIRDHA